MSERSQVAYAPGSAPSIPALAATACVRVRDRRGDVVGSGFLVGPDLVATCAHVVATATGADAYGPAPDTPVFVDFPALPTGPVERTARVHRWVPIDEDGTGDVALLRLAAPAPPGAVMSPVRRVDQLWDNPFRVFGFPHGRWDGVWATGRFRAGQSIGWLQLQGNPGDQPIEGGFSGAPVWDDVSGAVVGMTVAADRDPGITTAYLIPVEQVFGLDPELLPNPYRGLEPFGEEHAEYFFGRDRELRRLRATLDRHPLVAVAGPSGSGKSSLVRAGLLPQLRAEGAAISELRPMPGTPVLEALESILRAPDVVLAEPADPVGTPTSAHSVLFVDQFEELADSDVGAARELLDALAAVAAASGDGGALRVVLTMRGTALDEVLTAEAAEVLGPGTVLVGAMDRARLREVVVRPAERAPGLAFEDGLVERILDDAGTEPGRLPLVESLLAQLWTRREGGSLTVRGYEDAGGVAGALATHAEQVVAAAIEAGDVDRLRSLCTRLVAPAAEGRFVRRPVRLDELPDDLRALVPLLAAGRLVVAAGGRADGSVELAHQSLIEHWPRLRGWLETDQAFLAWRAELDAARKRWETAGHDDGGLLRGGALDAADRWLRDRPDEVGGAQAEYVRRSRARQRREVRRWRVVAAVLGVLVLAAGSLAVVAVQRGAQVAAQLATANADALAGLATVRAGQDPLLAAELAATAWHSDPASPSARTALADRYAAFSAADAVVAGASGGPLIGLVRVAGNLLVTFSETSFSFVRDPLGPAPTPWEGPDPAGVDRLQVAPDGSRVVILARDGSARLWDVGASGPTIELVAPGGPRVLSTGFSPDGSRLGWLVPEGPGRATVHVRDLVQGDTTSFSLALEATEARLRLTPDPGLVAVRPGDADVPWVLHTLSGGAPDRALPAGTTVQGGGALTSTCIEGSTGLAGRDAQLVVQDIVTGAERQRIEIPGYSCSLLWYSADGRYAVDPFSSTADPPAADMIRISDLATGVSYQALGPPLDPTTWTPGEASVVAATPDGRGGLVAFVAYGPSVLRIPAEREVGYDASFRTTIYDARGSVLSVRTTPALGTREFSTNDPASGTPIATMSAVTGSGWAEHHALWTFNSGPEGWQLDRYELPTLTRMYSVRPPDDPAADGPGGVVADTDQRIVVTLAENQMTAWDGLTGEQLGSPVRITGDPQVLRGIWAVEDRPGEVVVYTPAGLELWDVPGGRLLASFPELGRGGFVQVASRGGRMAYFTEGQLEIWDLATRERRATVPAPDLAHFSGFAPDGKLVAENVLRGEIIFWDVEQLSQAGTMRPSGDGIDAIDGDTLRVNGNGGRMPMELATTAEQWHADLCRLLPAELSPAARGLLPPGTDPSTGCP